MINHSPTNESNSPNSSQQRNTKTSQAKKSSKKEKSHSPQTQQSSKPRSSSDANPNKSDDKSPSLICWNCDQVGHRHNSCMEAKNIICYGSRRKNVTKPRCPTCAGKEKQSR